MRALIGQVVRLDLTDGHGVEGTLLNVNRSSVWVVHDDEDRFIPLADVAHLYGRA